MVLAELEKSKPGTTASPAVMFQVAADNSENGVWLIRAEGGFKLRTINGASTVTSPDTLTWRGGFARLVLIIGTTTVTLLDRDAGSSISLARPAWADAGVRTCLGRTRTVGGVVSNLCRVHRLAATTHPYALSDIQRRRNMDALTPYTPVLDGKGEYPDNAIIIALWESALGTYRNLAAPALNVQLVPVGNVTTIPGGIQTDGLNDTHVYAATGIPTSEVVTMLTTTQDFIKPEAYRAHVSFNSSATNAGNATLTRHGSGQSFPMQGKTDLSHNYVTVGDKVTQAVANFKLKLLNNAKSLECTELQGNRKGTVTGDVNWTGTVVIAWGTIKRSGGSYGDRCATKNLGTIVVRGELSADDLVTSKPLLNA